jgi:hypothetical protein
LRVRKSKLSIWFRIMPFSAPLGGLQERFISSLLLFRSAKFAQFRLNLLAPSDRTPIPTPPRLAGARITVPATFQKPLGQPPTANNRRRTANHDERNRTHQKCFSFGHHLDRRYSPRSGFHCEFSKRSLASRQTCRSGQTRPMGM